jgi:hypothetical protein
MVLWRHSLPFWSIHQDFNEDRVLKSGSPRSREKLSFILRELGKWLSSRLLCNTYCVHIAVCTCVIEQPSARGFIVCTIAISVGLGTTSLFLWRGSFVLFLFSNFLCIEEGYECCWYKAGGGPNERWWWWSSSSSQDHVIPDGRFVDYSRFVSGVLT